MTTEFLKWNNSFSVKVKEIDDQHKNLVNMLNELYSSFMNKAHEDKIEKIVSSLVDYTVYHFNTEEKYFHQFKYQDTAEHILEHNEFKKTVSHFQEKLKKNKTALTYEVINFLRDWLQEHIAVSDKKYSKCFVDNGLK